MNARIDHLVVAAASLDEGVAWCETTLGVTPGPGGEHPLMGTHNRLLRIATVDYPRAYLEIIAVQPGRSPQRPARWFDLDDAALQARLRTDGARLIHFVAQVPDARVAVGALTRLGIDRGEVLQASRATPRGLLQWQITVRSDGQRLAQGGLPTLIEWGDMHPAADMPESGVTLHAVGVRLPDPARLQRAHEAIGLEGVSLKPGAADLCAVLETPRGRVHLSSGGI